MNDSATFFKEQSSISDINMSGNFIMNRETGEKIGQLFKICPVQLPFESSPRERSVVIKLDTKTKNEEVCIDGIIFKGEKLEKIKFFDWYEE